MGRRANIAKGEMAGASGWQEKEGRHISKAVGHQDGWRTQCESIATGWGEGAGRAEGNTGERVKLQREMKVHYKIIICLHSLSCPFFRKSALSYSVYISGVSTIQIYVGHFKNSH